MSFIDWSDAEEMLGLLVEFVADERGLAHGDPARRQFLARLASSLIALQERSTTLPAGTVMEALRSISSCVEEEFATDVVVEHLLACVEELERITPHAINHGRSTAA